MYSERIVISHAYVRNSQRTITDLMITVSSPFKILGDTEGELGDHSLEYFIPATLRLRRGYPAGIKILSLMVTEFIF